MTSEQDLIDQLTATGDYRVIRRLKPVEKYHDELAHLFPDLTEKWKVTEAFRSALRASADMEVARLRSRRTVRIRILNISRLLATAPQPHTGAKPTRAGRLLGMF